MVLEHPVGTGPMVLGDSGARASWFLKSSWRTLPRRGGELDCGWCGDQRRSPQKFYGGVGKDGTKAKGFVGITLINRGSLKPNVLVAIMMEKGIMADIDSLLW